MKFPGKIFRECAHSGTLSVEANLKRHVAPLSFELMSVSGVVIAG
jgi:hypothetical protein